jgi:carbon-monoxide dehydrogenase large subunit
MKRKTPTSHPDRPQGIGASLLRKEDDRFMHGRGEYVGNIRMVGMVDVAFVRSPIAHGHIVGIEKPVGLEHAVYSLADLDDVKPIVANSGLPGFKNSEQPVLANGKVRQVGEMIAMCAAATRAQAEDIAAQVFVDF